MIHIIYISIIIILIFIIGVLMDMLEGESEKNIRYYKSLRQDYDNRIKKLKQENEELNRIIGGMRYG